LPSCLFVKQLVLVLMMDLLQCLRLLYHPVTLRCGHSFCAHCCDNLFKAKHAKCPTYESLFSILYFCSSSTSENGSTGVQAGAGACCRLIYRQAPESTPFVAVVPLKIDRLACPPTSRCRRVLPLHAQGADMGVSVSLARLLEQAFPREYRSRRDEVLAERGAAEAGGAHALLADASAGRADGGDAVLPIFYLDPMLPKQRLRLNIFEPRYRLMIRRCLEGSRKFGMVGVDLHAATRTRFPIPRHGVEVVTLYY